MLMHHSLTLQRSPSSSRITIQRRLGMFIPITQNRIEEMPGCFYCITPCKEGLVAQDTVFYQTGIGISAGDAPQLIRVPALSCQISTQYLHWAANAISAYWLSDNYHPRNGTSDEEFHGNAPLSQSLLSASVFRS